MNSKWASSRHFSLHTTSVCELFQFRPLSSFNWRIRAIPLACLFYFTVGWKKAELVLLKWEMSPRLVRVITHNSISYEVGQVNFSFRESGPKRESNYTKFLRLQLGKVTQGLAASSSCSSCWADGTTLNWYSIIRVLKILYTIILYLCNKSSLLYNISEMFV